MISIIPVGPNPYGVAVSADGAYLYVTTDDNRAAAAAPARSGSLDCEAAKTALCDQFGIDFHRSRSVIAAM